VVLEDGHAPELVRRERRRRTDGRRIARRERRIGDAHDGGARPDGGVGAIEHDGVIWCRSARVAGEKRERREERGGAAANHRL
jgi:hypothetical protein